MGGYGTIFVLFIVAGGIATTLHFLTSALGPRAPNALKSEPFECGNISKDMAPRVSVKFYIVALLFILFDMETVFLFPWAVIFKDLGWLGFWSMISFVFMLTIGLVYVWKKGALDWE